MAYAAQVSANSAVFGLLQRVVVLTVPSPIGSVNILMGKAPRLFRSTHGAVTTEYVIVVGAVGLLFVAALVAVGPTLVASYEMTRSVLASPYP